MQYPGTLFGDMGDTFTAENRDSKRNISQSTLISWFKNYTTGTTFFTIGVSTIGGNDPIKGSQGGIQYWDKYDYTNESNRVEEICIERSFKEPAVGSVAKSIADVKLQNNCNRYTPKYSNAKFMDDFAGTFTSDYAADIDLDASYEANDNTTMEANVDSLGYTGGTELVRNGSFEEGLSYWVRYEGQVIALGDGTLTHNCVAGAKDGSYCMKMSNTATDSANSYQGMFISVLPNTTYYYSFWVKLVGGNGVNGTYFNFYEYDAAYGNTASTNATTQTADTDWVEITGNFTTAATTVYILFRIYPARTTAGNTAECYYDKFRLSASPTDYDVKGGVEKISPEYEDFQYTAKLQNIWTTNQYNDCDDHTEWSIYSTNTLATDTTDKKEGTGSITFDKSSVAGAYTYVQRALANQDLTANDYFYLWFKTPATAADLAKISYLTIRFYTGSTANSWRWLIDKRQFPEADTWYRLVIDKNKFSSRAGTLNWADIDGFQFEVDTSAAADTLDVMHLDDVSFQNIRDLESGIYFRGETADAEDNCYRFIAKDQYHLALQKIDDQIVTDLQVVDYDTTTSQYYYFKVDAHEDRIKCYISTAEPTESNLVIEYFDSTYKKGKVGLFNNVAHTHCSYIALKKEADIKDQILPSRPIRIAEGYELGGVDYNIPKFVGVTKGMPETDNRTRTTKIHAQDNLDYLWSKKIDNTGMWTAETTDVILEDILQDEFGFATSQYELDNGINVVPFAYTEKGKEVGGFLQDLVEAEMGSLYQDENGIIRFENRQHWTYLPHSRPCYNIYTAQVIDEKLPRDDKIINLVEVEGRPRARQAYQPLWATPIQQEIPPLTATTLWYNFSDPMWSIETPVAYTHYEAWDNQEKDGEDLTGNVTIQSIDKFSTSCSIKWYNSSTKTAYLFLTLWGEPCRETGEVYYREQDDSSVTAYQEKPYKITNNYISQSYCASMARMILENMSDPLDYKELTVKAIPQLQLGDLISYQGHWWHLYSIKEQMSAQNGYTQIIKLVKKTISIYFRVGISTIGGTDRIAP